MTLAKGALVMSHIDQDQQPSAQLLEMLVCPVTKGMLIYDAKGQRLISEQLKKAFPIRAGVPILVIEEALALDDNSNNS